MLIEISLGCAEEEENGLIHSTSSFDKACGSEFWFHRVNNNLKSPVTLVVYHNLNQVHP